MYDQKLGGERAERQRAEQASVVRRQMAEFERNFRAKLGSCSAQVWAQLFAVHYGDAAAGAASQTILNDLRARDRGDRLGLSAALNRRRFALPLDMWLPTGDSAGQNAWGGTRTHKLALSP